MVGDLYLRFELIYQKRWCWFVVVTYDLDSVVFMILLKS